MAPRAACALIVVLLLAGAGCAPVHFSEKRHLADPAMRLDSDPTEAHFHQKALSSREGAAGGAGQGAGGGCGCY